MDPILLDTPTQKPKTLNLFGHECVEPSAKFGKNPSLSYPNAGNFQTQVCLQAR